MKIKLTKDEYDLLWATIERPIGMFFYSNNPNYFFDKFGVQESQLESMEKKLEKFENNLVDGQIILDFLENDYKELVRCFKAAKLYLSPVELPTMTRYSWEEAEKLEKKLEESLRS